MFNQTQSAHNHTAATPPTPATGPVARRIVTGALALTAALVGTQLAAPPSASAAAAASGLHQEKSAAVKLTGSWTSHTSDKAIGGSYANLNTTGNAQISLTSTGIAWIARRNAYAGIATVYLDGIKKKTVDLYAPSTQYQQTAYTITGLKNTTHTLKIVRTGTKNAKSGGRNLILDAFNVLDTNGWIIAHNTGHNAPLDGIQIWAGFDGYGYNNPAYHNTLTGTMPGYAIRLAYNYNGNIAGCDNTKAPDSINITNKTCQP